MTEISSTTNTPTPARAERSAPVEHEQDAAIQERRQETQRAEATQQNERPAERRPDPDDRVGTRVDTQA